MLTTSCVLIIKQLNCDGESGQGFFRLQVHFECLNLSHDSKCPDTHLPPETNSSQLVRLFVSQCYDWSRCFRMNHCISDTHLFDRFTCSIHMRIIVGFSAARVNEMAAAGMSGSVMG